MSKWFMSDIVQTKIPDGFDVLVTTDTPVHLWLRYTGVTPLAHRRFILKRGLYAAWDLRQCFVAYSDLEQVQDGDTLLHTFLWYGWYDCLWRWFYFWGLISSVVSKSTSPIFTKHYEELVWPFVFHEPWTWYGVDPPVFTNLFTEHWSS